MTHIAILVTGDRHATPEKWRKVIDRALDGAKVQPEDHVILIHGDATGIDRIAKQAAIERGWQTLPMPYVGSLGPRGGPVRNELMVNVTDSLRQVGYYLYTLAFHDNINGSKGTKGCTRLMIRAGMYPLLFTSDGECCFASGVIG